MEGKLFRDTTRGTPQGGIASPALANVYLHELDRYMEQYTGLSLREKQQRRKHGVANFLYVRYCDDFVVLCNGTKAQAEAMRQELHQFLQADLKLELSLEKTKVTHVDDGFKFLGFWLQRRVGTKGKRVTKVLIPEEAPRAFLGKIRRALKPATHRDSVKTKVIALNRIIQGWGRYYQYTSSPKAVFHKLDYHVFWLMAHWLGRKYQLSIPKVLQRFHRRSSLGTATLTVAHLGELPTKRYLARVIPNPYLAPPDQKLWREELFSLDAFWSGDEADQARPIGGITSLNAMAQSVESAAGLSGVGAGTRPHPTPRQVQTRRRRGPLGELPVTLLRSSPDQDAGEPTRVEPYEGRTFMYGSKRGGWRNRPIRYCALPLPTQWTKRGAHLLRQVRTQVLNGRPPPVVCSLAPRSGGRSRTRATG